MAKQDGSRIFTVRIHPDRDAELYRAVASRVDAPEDGGQGMTFKEFLQMAVPRAFPGEFAGGDSPAVSADYVPPVRAGADDGLLEWDGGTEGTPAEGVSAEPALPAPDAPPETAPAPVPVPASLPASLPSSPPATPGVPQGYGLDARLDANLRRAWGV